MNKNNLARKIYGDDKNRGGAATSAGAILKTALKRFNLEADIERYSFVLRWNEIVGPSLAQFTKPSHVNNGVLFVKVTSSVLAQELTFQRQMILDSLREVAPESGEIRDVHFLIAAGLD